MSRPTSTQVQNLVSHLNPGGLSPPSRTRELQLNFLRLTFHLNLLDSRLLPIQIASHLNPGPYICLWTTTRWCFTSIPVLPSCISDPPRHHLKPIQVSKCASNFHPGPAQRNSGHQILVSPSSMSRLHQGPKICISPPSRLHLNLIQAPIFTSHLHTSTHIKVSATSRSCLTSIQVLIFASHFHSVDVSPPSMSCKMQLSYTQVPSQTHTGLKMSVLSPSRSCLTCIEVKRFLYHHHPCTVSPPSVSHITISQFTRCVAQVHQRPISTPSEAPRFAPHPLPGRVSFPSWLCITPTQVTISFIFIYVLPHLHPGQKILISSPSMYRLTSIQVTYHLHSLHKMYISSSSMPSLNSIRSP